MLLLGQAPKQHGRGGGWGQWLETHREGHRFGLDLVFLERAWPEVAVAHADVAGPEPGQIRLPKLLVHLGLAASGAEANRKIAEKAVKLDGEVAESALISVTLPARLVVRLGKRAKVAAIA